jgi:hypothetical protein
LQAQQLAQITGENVVNVLARFTPSIDQEAQRQAAVLMLAHTWLCLCTEPKRALAGVQAVAAAMGVRQVLT